MAWSGLLPAFNLDLQAGDTPRAERFERAWKQYITRCATAPLQMCRDTESSGARMQLTAYLSGSAAWRERQSTAREARSGMRRSLLLLQLLRIVAIVVATSAAAAAGGGRATMCCCYGSAPACCSADWLCCCICTCIQGTHVNAAAIIATEKPA